MEYKETFIQVIVNTLKELSKVDFAYEELDARSQYKSLKEITSQIGIYGDDHEGLIILNLDSEFLKYLYYKIGEEELEDDFIIEDFCGELTNILAGKFIEFIDLDITLSLPIINFDPIEYSTIKKNSFNAFHFFNNKGHEFFIFTYLAKTFQNF